MLSIQVKAHELYDERCCEFIEVKPTTLQLEHSLISISKWESKWKKPFLADNAKSDDEIRDYVRCMTVSGGTDPNVYAGLTQNDYENIKAYIDDSMTATSFSDKSNKPSREIITSEIIYYWMITCDIPFECQKWHLNRLLSLIKVCSIKNTPGKKMSKNELLNRNMSLNKQRRAALGTRG